MIQLDFGQNIDTVFCGSQGDPRFWRKSIIGADSEQILTIHMERPGYGVYWSYGCAVYP
jgi:hypothetical protein